MLIFLLFYTLLDCRASLYYDHDYYVANTAVCVYFALVQRRFFFSPLRSPAPFNWTFVEHDVIFMIFMFVRERNKTQCDAKRKNWNYYCSRWHKTRFFPRFLFNRFEYHVVVGNKCKCYYRNATDNTSTVRPTTTTTTTTTTTPFSLWIRVDLHTSATAMIFSKHFARKTVRNDETSDYNWCFLIKKYKTSRVYK